ncbi:unnamed protein product [Cylicocyclus nassatus]|uniref:Uncharacterized protein n=1 Tax=Cylicocyclus nassatus TaxID=53992 RepID=A0AA36H5I8_CYLNA|nr:unnamed protein product [Cylicocyclus nassatus]
MKPMLFACILLAVFSSTLAAQSLQCYEGDSGLDNRHKRDCPKTVTFCYTSIAKNGDRAWRCDTINQCRDKEGCRPVLDGELCCCKKKLCNLLI